jgi:hypothetical protein
MIASTAMVHGTPMAAAPGENIEIPPVNHGKNSKLTL